MQIAFKEWAIVVEALGRGGQILILRKGGIAEGRGGFHAEHERFWLFPTGYHQQAEGVIPAESARFTQMRKPDENFLSIEFCCEIVETRSLTSLEHCRQLAGQHIWREEIIADRFHWGHEPSLIAMVVRVRRLAAAVELPMREQYGGCKSWVELEAELNFAAATPVLEDAVFGEKLRLFREALA